MLISHCKVFALLFLCLCNPFQKDHYDHRSALLLAVWQGRYYNMQKSPIHNKLYSMKIQKLCCQVSWKSLLVTRCPCDFSERSNWNNVCVDVHHLLHLRVKQLLYGVVKYSIISSSLPSGIWWWRKCKKTFVLSYIHFHFICWRQCPSFRGHLHQADTSILLGAAHTSLFN